MLRKKQQRVIVFLVIILSTIAVILSFYLLFFGRKFDIDYADIFSLILRVWVCVGSFISVVFVISSYIQTNRAFVLSQKPHLLLFVANKQVKITEKFFHHTVIAYQNKSRNPFYDLSINVNLSTSRKNFDLSDLFTKNMYMAACDERERTFVTNDEFSKRGFDFSEITQNNQITLSLHYEHTFNGEKEIISVQEYYWDTSSEKPQWSIK